MKELNMLDSTARPFVQPILEWIAGILIKCGVTANHVTYLSLIVGVVGGALVFCGLFVSAVVCVCFARILDGIDGTIARKRGNATAWGCLIDITFDQIVLAAVIISLALRFPQAQFSLLFLSVVLIISMTVFSTLGALTERPKEKHFYYSPGLVGGCEETILLSAMILFSSLLVPLTIVFSVGKLITTLQRLRIARTSLCPSFNTQTSATLENNKDSR